MPFRLTPAQYALLESILGSGKSGRAAVKWTALKKLFEDDFNHTVEEQKPGVYRFTPRADTPSTAWPFTNKSFTAYKPKGKTLTPEQLNDLRSTFRESYDWDKNTFQCEENNPEASKEGKKDNNDAKAQPENADQKPDSSDGTQGDKTQGDK